MANKVKEIWASGKVVVNAWLAIPSGFSAEVMAQCGFDSVTVDMQHGVQDYLSMVQCFQAMHGHPVTPMVRVPWNEPGIIGKVLDGGAYGVICPMINTPEEAERSGRLQQVSAARHPLERPDPRRNVRHGRQLPEDRQRRNRVAADDGDQDRDRQHGSDPRCRGHQRRLYRTVRPGFSYGLVPKLDRDEPEILKIYEKIVKECGKRGLYPGIHCRAPTARARASTWASSW